MEPVNVERGDEPTRAGVNINMIPFKSATETASVADFFIAPGQKLGERGTGYAASVGKLGIGQPLRLDEAF